MSTKITLLIAVLVCVIVGVTIFFSTRHDQPLEPYTVDPINPRAIPTWIQYDERVVGENHPSYTDVANRVTKTIWLTYTSEHNTDGTHKYSAAYNNKYAITGSGSSDIASVSNVDEGCGFNLYSSVTFFSVIQPDALDTAEGIYKLYDNEHSAVTFNFTKTVGNRLAMTIVSNNYSSLNAVFTADNLDQPIEVGVILDHVDADIKFFYGGYVEAPQDATYSGFSPTTSELHLLGEDLNGEMFFFSGAQALMFASDTNHTPLSEGLSNCPNCFLQYNFNEGTGSTLTDVNADAKGTTAYDMTITGTWTDVPNGY